jgi:hypothetical protein
MGRLRVSARAAGTARVFRKFGQEERCSRPGFSFAFKTGLLYIVYNVMRFEWDEQKNLANQKKHDSLDFETAALVFRDPDVVYVKDRIVDGEQRWHAVGIVRTAILLVVHIYLEDGLDGEETIRIISAREASKRERRVYLAQASN